MPVSLPEDYRPTPPAQSGPRRPVCTATRTWSVTNPAGNRTLGLKVWTGGRGASPLPLSAVLLDNERGCAWPDRTVSGKKIRIGSRGHQPCVAACQADGHFLSSSSRQAACQPKWLATSEVRRTPNARNHHPPVPGLQEPELLHHQEQEDHHRPA